ncbi:MAG: hypothetical protein JST58_04440 [Bacteroidetes bacterium]|nr:hypothetical protein [Bacteroidota bacterium]
MKKYFFILLAMGALKSQAQQTTNPQAQLTPQQKQLLKQMGIDASDPKKAAAQMKLMKQQGKMPDFKTQGQNRINNMMVNSGTKTTKSAADFGYFTNNASLVPDKDLKRINSVSKKIYSNAEMLSNTQLLYNKMIAKLPAEEKNIISSITAQQTNPENLNKASVKAMMQGHQLAALGLAMQAVIAQPSNLNYQNNMAALLTNNGYPENAIPYLNTIQQQLPNNSTVKNNLGYAWLNLGEIDSAQRILTAAAALNPENAETETGTGVIQEKKGNTEEAGKKYEEAFVESPSAMGEMILQNARRGNPYDDMTFDQIKNKITIYEYFKKEWVNLPSLSNSVDGYQADIGILNGYTEMFKGIMLKIQAIEDSIRNSKETEFPSIFNRYAQNIIIPIANYKGKYALTNYDEDAVLEENVKKAYKKAEDDCYDKQTGQAAKCEVQDNIYTGEYLQKVNPDIKKFFEKKLEKQRVWINAFITYRMLVMNPQPKQQLLEVLYYSKLFMNRVAEAIGFLKDQESACNLTYNRNAITAVKPYELPKLLCPVNINSMPGANNNISKSASSKAPNVSIAFESGDGSIAEPGKGGTPYFNTSQGEVNSSGYNGQDAYGNFKQSIEKDDLAPLAKINDEDELTPLAKILKEEDDLAPLAIFTKEGDMLEPLAKIIEKHNLKKWLQDQLATNCDDLKKRDPYEETLKLIDAMEAADELKMDKQNLQKKLDQLNQQNDPANAAEIASGNKIMQAIEAGQQSIDKKNQTNPGWADKISGVAPTIVNSLQTSGSNTSFIKGLFN